MNDPHVVALYYRIESGPGVEFKEGVSLLHSTEQFDLCVRDGRATFTLNEHFATEAEARSLVEPLIRAWVISSGLETKPGDFVLSWERSEIVDRAPTPRKTGDHVLQPATARLSVTGGMVAMTVTRTNLPTLPKAFSASPDVEALYWQYSGFLQERIPLAAMGYFCLNYLEHISGDRSRVTKRYKVSNSVLGKLGTLTSTKGGKDARKGKGATVDFTDSEEAWIRQAVKLLIKRVAEEAANPSGPHTPITMADLPPLQSPVETSKKNPSLHLRFSPRCAARRPKRDNIPEPSPALCAVLDVFHATTDSEVDRGGNRRAEQQAPRSAVKPAVTSQ